MNRTAVALVSLLAAISPAVAQNCAGTSTGRVPLTDLGAGTYQGFTGGLYGGGQNAPPAAHALAGAARIAAITPRDALGAPSASGRVVLLSVGMSNTTQEFSAWKSGYSDPDPNRSTAVTVVDGAQGGQDAVTIANPNAAFWTNIDARLALAGVTAQQVQVAWLKEAIAGHSGTFPASAQTLQNLLGPIVRIMKTRYPNLQVCFLSSRIYAGYATTMLNPEPHAYESGFAVRWLIEQQIGGDPNLAHDPTQGPAVAPWLAWGPYLWADGLVPRSDGLTWACSDYSPDGTHPGTVGRDKVAQRLQAHFTTDPFATPWYVGQGGGTTTAAVFATGAGCAGQNGVPGIRNNTTPFLGNPTFRIGVQFAAPNRPAAWLLAAGPADVPLAGACSLRVDPALLIVALGTTIEPNGASTFTFAVANDPGMMGQSLWCQWLIDDPAGTPFLAFSGIALSGGARLRFGIE